MNSKSGYLSKENENTNLKRYVYPYVHCSIIYYSQDTEGTSVPINRWANKEDVVCVCAHIHTPHTGILFSHKKNAILPFAATWVDLDGILLSEVSQKEKNKYRMLMHVCGT